MHGTETGDYNSLLVLWKSRCIHFAGIFGEELPCRKISDAFYEQTTKSDLAHVHHEQLRLGHFLDGVAQAFAPEA
jgi:hypothetical protein